MPLLLLLLVLLLPLVMVLLLPLTLVQRYRVGTSRRLARRWVSTLNLVTLALSAVMLVVTAALTNIWVANAAAYTLGGLLFGGILGWLGLRATRWEASGRVVHYTPNRWIVLLIVGVISARVAYSFWRTWQLWSAGIDATSWLMTSGVAGSFAAGAVVLGYYLSYWFGVRRRLKGNKSG